MWSHRKQDKIHLPLGGKLIHSPFGRKMKQKLLWSGLGVKGNEDRKSIDYFEILDDDKEKVNLTLAAGEFHS